jgi:hypothetical protein
MKDKLEKLHQKMSLFPYKTIKQTITKDQSIYVFDLSKDIDCELISKLCKEGKQNIVENKRDTSLENVVHSWSTDYIENQKVEKPFLDLFNIVEKRVEQIYKNYTYCVDHFWYVIYHTNDSAIPHAHGNCDIASVFYPYVPKNSSPICFMPNINENEKSQCIDVKTGNLVVFPGELIHFVPNSLHDGDRISISMNLFKKNKIKVSSFT